MPNPEPSINEENTMNKTLLATALVAVIAATAFAPTAQAANSGTITISGKVLSDTCTVSVNNGSTVALPTVMTASLGTVGATAGTTPFTIALSGCDANTTSAAMSFSGANIDAGTGNLKNTVAGGSNVQVQLLNGASVINASSGTNAPTITVTGGNGSVAMNARYVAATAAATAGMVASTVSFTLSYQ
jgi:major type 1 subunit fimbrin (pilin)